MATDVDQSYYGWSHEELSDGDEHQTSVSQALDHGSISFGRFASETLSWERRSVFTHNRRQEELDQFNGLVAKKKAYFEERYRRLRALKASQQNQQTELVLEYGGNGSNSSQSGEEDHGKIPKNESLKDGIENSAHASSGEAKTEPSFDQAISCNEASQRNELDPEPITQDTSPGRRSLENIEQGRSSIDEVQIQSFETESSWVRENMEVNEASHSNSLDCKEITRERENLESSVKPKAASHESMTETKSSKVGQLNSIKKSQGHKSVPKAKDSASGIRSGRTLRQETKLDVVRPSKGIKDTSRKMVGKAESSHLSRKTTINRVKSNNRSTMVDSNRPLRETQSKTNIPGPFTLVMERRASSRASEVNLHSRIPNKFTSPLTHANSGPCVQNLPKKTTATTEVKNVRGSDTKRVFKEERKKPLASDNRTSFRRTQDPLLTSKSRSVNLPARTNYGGSTSGIGNQPSSITGNNQKKEKEGIWTPGVGTRMDAPSMTIAAKPTQFQNSELLRSGRRQRRHNPSLDESKARQEIPQWR